MALSESAVYYLPSSRSAEEGISLESVDPCMPDRLCERPALNTVDKPQYPVLDKPPSHPCLTALAQLGAYRFGCSRSCVILFDGDEPNVIADATPALFLNEHGKDDLDSQLLQRVASWNLQLQRDRSAVGGKSRNKRNRCQVIRDLAPNDHERDSPFQFFATTSLSSPRRGITGAYCIVDTKPHPTFGKDEVASMQEIADLIDTHMKDFTAREARQKSQQLVEGLMTFVGGQTEVENEEKLDGAKGRESRIPSTSDISIPDSVCNGGGSVPTTPCRVSDAAPLESIPTTPSEQASRLFERRNSVTVTEASTVSQSMSLLFSRASALLRKCMDLDGVLFLDVARSNCRAYVSHPSTLHDMVKAKISSSRSGSISDIELLSRDDSSNLSSPGYSTAGPGRERECEPFAYNLSSVAETSRCSSRYTLTATLLHDLCKAFPKGAIFNSDLFSECANQKCDHKTEKEGSSRHSLPLRLVNELPEAKSLVFLPLWNWNTSSWLAGTILWTEDGQRHFHDNDLCYLRAFGHSIIAEVAHTDWHATEKSKSDLLSSVSHELRSPLHGMLASVELLHCTELQAPQQDMLTMIETCGLTLLDTVNYLLDFAKINNLTSPDAQKGVAETSLNDLHCEFNLDTLVEDVVDTLYAGHRSHINASQIAGRYLPSGPAVGTRSTKEAKGVTTPDGLSVIVRFGQEGWRVQSIPGGWRRIVMNLLGNAFKFTMSGFIEVTLDKKVERGAGCTRVLAHLTITDTGSGISPEYLDHKLYTPFTQENMLTEGVGLGLSIVHRLVAQAGGLIDVKSTVGIGTQVDVYIPVEFVDASPTNGISKPCELSNSSRARVSLVGLNVYPEVRNGRRLSVETKRKLSVRGAMSNAVLNQPGWTVAFANSLVDASGDIAVIEESSLADMTKLGPISPKVKALIVLGSHGISSSDDVVVKGVEVIYIPQP
ncbi:sensor histidine kinase [Aspergillus clavatus NRRL 1]|uniref:Sensor histidine kinase/response regulator, putative n=1 Tax=Aspergillus clavatus (strain ATCC 1007 / CBS 513.65 / DSM 816 / NCTC 3887 / NRRL 1 / QM 1276 / 107) TaxID=344612 RepID=A1CLS5_ASPCL|nr:sensor histidine kinase/response regulator, putative [Aspergillus clavatus NRRL 1]EAW09054.1 sensor histidine kinase/response regulator, putative [Aspergillus clavatus NRRL 1]